MKSNYPLIIAEVGQAHEGSLGIAHSYIEALAKTGVHAVKFQTHIAAAESSEFESFRVKFSYEDATRYDYWKRMEFTAEQWKGLKDHCEEVGLEFISSPFSNAAVDLLEELGVTRYKIGSGEISNFLMLERIAQTAKPILLSSGMSSFEELDRAIKFLSGFGNELAILQCTTAYPTQPEEWGLNVIGELRSRYHWPIGFSDHSGDIYACLAAAACGAQIFEFHVVFDKMMFGPDAKSSLTIRDIERLANGISQIARSLGNPMDKSDNGRFTELKEIFEKSLAVNKDLKAGHKISIDDLESKKPKGYGIDAQNFKSVIDKVLVRDLEKGAFLNADDLE